MMRMIMGRLIPQYPWTDITSEEARDILQEFGKEPNLRGTGTFGRGNPSHPHTPLSTHICLMSLLSLRRDME